MMKISKQAKLFIILGLLFSAPSVLAVWLQAHPEWLSTKTTNKGQLVKEVPSLSLPQDEKKWRIAYWSQGPCQKECREQLDKLYHVRLVLGRKYYQVQEYLLASQDVLPAEDEQVHNQGLSVHSLNEQDTRQLIETAKHYPQAEVFIISPDNHVVLSYSSTAEQKDIYSDIKHLLTITNN